MYRTAAGARQILRSGDRIAWKTENEEGTIYLAMFNTGCMEQQFELAFDKLGMEGAYQVRELWEHKDIGREEKAITASIPSHGAALYRMELCE